ncbi:unnamed protein product [Rotaria magnacalcarata]|nr:unnamed protein product [Rotaria magnacalcarata]
MFVIIYLMPYFGRGPFCPTEQGFELTGCRNGYLWTSIIYIGNLIKPDNMCLSVTCQYWINLLYYPSLVTHGFDMPTNDISPNFFDNIHITPWCHISPYAIGLLTGFIVVNTRRNYRLNRFFQPIGTDVTITIALVCIFSIYGDYILVPGINRVYLIAYQTLFRPARSISII